MRTLSLFSIVSDVGSWLAAIIEQSPEKVLLRGDLSHEQEKRMVDACGVVGVVFHHQGQLTGEPHPPAPVPQPHLPADQQELAAKYRKAKRW